MRRIDRSEQGFTLVELTIVLMIVGLLTAALIRMALPLIESARITDTRLALETARDALIAFAAANNGCLPFAADVEGGLPDTDSTGAAAAGYADKGVWNLGRSNSHAGDLPWADLGLGPDFLDGDDLRLQYYVASPYTDADKNPADGYTCAAGFRGYEWNQNVSYDGSTTPLYVYYDPGSGRSLYKIVGALPAGTTPADGGPGVTEDVTATGPSAFPASLLQYRRGPEVRDPLDGQSEVMSVQNAFVLIAPGTNVGGQGRTHVRDSTHARDATSGQPWPLNWPAPQAALVDERLFSSEHNIEADEGDNGDDTLLWMSFINFKAALNKFGLNMEAICDDEEVALSDGINNPKWTVCEQP